MCDMIDDYKGIYDVEPWGEPIQNVSEYEDSDGDVYSLETNEEDDRVLSKQRKIVYDPKCNHKELKIVLGMRFQDGLQCKQALSTHSIELGRFLHFRRVSKKQLEAKCNPPCPWRVYDSAVRGEGTLIIKAYGGDHNCPIDMNNKLLSSQWIANKYLYVFRMRPDLNIKDLRADIVDRFSTDVAKDRLYKARSIARQMLKGSVDAHYASIRRYLAELRKVDAEGIYELLLRDGNIFKGVYMGFSTLRKGFKMSCRPLVGLDGCHLKTYLKGILLCVVGKDGNNQMFPISWAVVEIENEECWTWFLKCFLEDLGTANGQGLTFISDQQKELQNAVSKVAPLSEHRNCAKHVYMNWKKQHKGTLNDTIDNNISETFNGYILNARGKHVIHMCEEISCALMVRQATKYEEMSVLTDRICPEIRKRLEKLRYYSRHCISYPAMDLKFQVDVEADVFAVDIKNRSCRSREWDLTGIPCIHAISAIHYMKRDPSDFVHEYYTVQKYLEGYQFRLEPINGEKMWPEVDGCIVRPPLIRKMPSRPKKKRIRAPEENDPKNPTKLSKHGMRVTCRNCQQLGHNRRGCKNQYVQNPPKEKGQRGRPAKPKSIVTSQGNQNQSLPAKVARKRNFIRRETEVYTSELPSQRRATHLNQKVTNTSKNQDSASTSGVQKSAVTEVSTQESGNANANAN